MSDTILSGDFTVYYTNDTGGDKQVRWTGSATGTRTVNELYGAIQDLFDNDSGGAGSHMAEGIPMSAQTPTSYTIGRIEVNDTEPWFIDIDSVKHLKGGSLETTGWTRVTSSATGIVKFNYTVGGGTDFVTSDIGKVVTHSVGGDSGRLLYFTSNGSSGTAWVRPDSNAAANNWDSTGTNVTVTSGIGANLNQTAAATSGNSIWSNIYSIGTIASNTELYVYQNGSTLTQWWATGHIDILVLTTDMSTSPIDNGFVTIYARQYSKLYDHFIADVSSGGRTPIPLATSSDNNNTTGYRTFTATGISGTFNVGNYIYFGASWAAATKKGVLTAVSGSDLTYYLIGDLTDFSNGNAITEWTGSANDATATAGTPSAAGPNTGTAATITATFGATSQDLNNGNGSRPYSVIVDCQSVPIATVYERLKYITRRGYTSDIDAGSQTITGEQYVSIGNIRLPYDAQSTAFVEGETVNGQTSGATGIVTADHDAGTTGALILRTVRGTFQDNENIRSGVTVRAVANIPSGAEDILVSKTAPFGTFAGGKFFGARGVWLADVNPSDATNYELIDSEGIRQQPPNTIPIVVKGVVQNTQCYVADSVPNVYLNTTATSNVSGDQYQASTTLNYTSDIAVTVRAREMGYLPFETSGTISTSGLSVTAVWLVDSNFKLVVSGINISFTNPSTITRASGDFSTDGWLAVMSQVTVEGSASNDGTYTISAVGTTTLTITGATLTTEGPITNVTLTFTRRTPTW